MFGLVDIDMAKLRIEEDRTFGMRWHEVSRCLGRPHRSEGVVQKLAGILKAVKSWTEPVLRSITAKMKRNNRIHKAFQPGKF